ncbi:MAG: hypothetical protein R3354_00550 [Thiohalomonadales bacterium]|nr:hypothetical protein [Thiohalomonadales bacterium]
MNSNFNYSGFIDMFLETDDEFEPYGIITESLQTLEPQPQSVTTEDYIFSKALLSKLD